MCGTKVLKTGRSISLTDNISLKNAFFAGSEIPDFPDTEKKKKRRRGSGVESGGEGDRVIPKVLLRNY